MKKSIAKSKVRHGKIQEVIETPGIIAVFDVPVTFVPEMPDEPLLDAKTIRFLDEARRRARAGDKNWLKKHGAEIFVDSSAA